MPAASIEAVEPIESADSHLRSSEAVTDYSIEAVDGEIGHLDGYIVDDDGPSATSRWQRNWWPGKRVLVSPVWIERVSWPESKVYTGLSREAIRKPRSTSNPPITQRV